MNERVNENNQIREDELENVKKQIKIINFYDMGGVKTKVNY